MHVVILAALEREKMRCALLLLNYVNLIQVVIVAGFHLFPFRTEKLSPPAPMVLHTRGGVPPLPIPNREVKPARADGTAHPWESR